MELCLRKKLKVVHLAFPGWHQDHPVHLSETSIGLQDATTSTLEGLVVTITAPQPIVAQCPVKFEAMKLPPELFTEICTLLEPSDLSSLIRTCTPLRDFLLDPKSKKRIWDMVFKRARAMGMPEPPSHLSQPACAHLLSAPCCHNCGKADIRKVIWPWFKRYCSACLPSMYIGPLEDVRVHIPQLAAYIDTLKATGPIVKPNMQAIREVLRVQREDVRKRADVARRWDGWFRMQKLKRDAALDRKRKERLKQIIECLKADGWEKELQFLGHAGLEEIAKFPMVRQSSELTPFGYTQVAYTLDKFLNETRSKRIWRERLYDLEAAIVAHYVKQFPRTPETDFRLAYIEFALMKDCRALVDAPHSQMVTRDDFVKILPRLAEQHLTSLKAQFTAILLEHFCLPPDRVDEPLDLAVATWMCGLCKSQPMHFPEVLAHPCAYEPRSWRVLDYCRDDPYVNNAVNLHATSIAYGWEHARLPFQFDFVTDNLRSRLQRVCDVVKAMGYDPQRTTWQEIEASEVRLECVDCRSLPNYAPGAYVFEVAVEHSLLALLRGQEHRTWARVPQGSMLNVRRNEAMAHDTLSHWRHLSTGCIWACALCVDWCGRGDAAREHMRSKHDREDMEDCVREGTVYLSDPLTNKITLKIPVPWEPYC
ncbi:hypothetical protein K466DRAFT_650444 [Polyporus arcularius HHB13444]|uniref:F-box domain-containing protein n=1 Tax=Polyporus arcularius HHB13444 TaxID=1314778 RepID=A0A5C3PX56_9APHY|nr:hypothetical protein K466DRAFT_650444 [Polyporus arcularius HHB13444]